MQSTEDSFWELTPYFMKLNAHNFYLTSWIMCTSIKHF